MGAGIRLGCYQINLEYIFRLPAYPRYYCRYQFDKSLRLLMEEGRAAADAPVPVSMRGAKTTELISNL